MTVPCRGYAGSCAELSDIYYRFAVAGITGELYSAPGLQCAAFPDPDKSSDVFFAGLSARPAATLLARVARTHACTSPSRPAVSAAVAMSIASVVSTCFSLSLATDAKQMHGRTRLLRWSLGQRLLFGGRPWEYAPGALYRCKLYLAGSWAAPLAQVFIVALVDACASARARLFGFRRTRPLSRVANGHDDGSVAPPDEETLQAELVDDAAAFSRVTEAYRRGALFLMYAAWAIFTWIIFVCACPPAFTVIRHPHAC